MYTVAPRADDALACLLAALWRDARPAVLLAGGAGKAVYFLACAALIASGVGKPLVLLFGIGDLAMAGFFGWALLG